MDQRPDHEVDFFLNSDEEWMAKVRVRMSLTSWSTGYFSWSYRDGKFDWTQIKNNFHMFDRQSEDQTRNYLNDAWQKKLAEGILDDND